MFGPDEFDTRPRDAVFRLWIMWQLRREIVDLIWHISKFTAGFCIAVWCMIHLIEEVIRIYDAYIR